MAEVVGRPWLSWRLLMVTECHLENVGQGPLQPLSRRRPLIRRKTIRNKPNTGARQPRATCWLLAVQLKVTSMTSDMGSLASHSHVLGSTYHRETLSPFCTKQTQVGSRSTRSNSILPGTFYSPPGIPFCSILIKLSHSGIIWHGCDLGQIIKAFWTWGYSSTKWVSHASIFPVGLQES